MTHDNTAEPTVKRAAFPMAIMRGGTPLFHAPGTFPPEYRRDAQLEALWRAGQPQPTKQLMFPGWAFVPASAAIAWRSQGGKA